MAPHPLLRVARLTAVIFAFVYTAVSQQSPMSSPDSQASDEFKTGMQAYERGDYATAIRLWKPVASGGFTEAQVMLGGIYEDGLGTARDCREAIKWYSLAAAQHSSEAYKALGIVYLAGCNGVRTNEFEAMKWFTLCARTGDPSCQNTVGENYLREDPPKETDAREASKWLEQSARQGMIEAQKSLAMLYWKGWGGARDRVRAYVWSVIASRDLESQDLKLNPRLGYSGPDEEALRAVAIMESQMTSDELNSAKEMVKSWKEKKQYPSPRQRAN